MTRSLTLLVVSALLAASCSGSITPAVTDTPPASPVAEAPAPDLLSSVADLHRSSIEALLASSNITPTAITTLVPMAPAQPTLYRIDHAKGSTLVFCTTGECHPWSEKVAESYHETVDITPAKGLESATLTYRAGPDIPAFITIEEKGGGIIGYTTTACVDGEIHGVTLPGVALGLLVVRCHTTPTTDTIEELVEVFGWNDGKPTRLLSQDTLITLPDDAVPAKVEGMVSYCRMAPLGEFTISAGADTLTATMFVPFESYDDDGPNAEEITWALSPTEGRFVETGRTTAKLDLEPTCKERTAP